LSDDYFNGIFDCFVVAFDPCNFAYLPSRNDRCRAIWHSEFATERILVSKSGEIWIQVNELLVLTFYPSPSFLQEI